MNPIEKEGKGREGKGREGKGRGRKEGKTFILLRKVAWNLGEKVAETWRKVF